MSEEIFSALATIKGAQIQAYYTLIASCVGAIGIVVGIILSWYTALHLQKVSRLAETRKGVYLEFAEAYSMLLNGLQLIQIEKHKYQNELFSRFSNFSTCLDKIMFVCNTETKKEVVNYINNIMPNIELIMFEIAGYFDLSQKLDALVKDHDESIESLKNLYQKLDELRIENPSDERTDNIFKLIEFKLKESERLIQPIIEKEKEFEEKHEQIAFKIKKITNDLNANIGEVIFMLRKEIGAKTDIHLDQTISVNYQSQLPKKEDKLK
ncbi:hypothetical protein J647_3647 [Acinetobacter baumannii 846928]|uniref:hypothetical protein n=1 Tax=Acinetobacter baumannii TaxID=470 RepID=UPI000446109D|nr:hypothetical protein [Acinetobacter baumannii]EXI35463.1 hypothetical protein J647_3647 [Acinetobacter baumannii 846928]